MNFTHIQDDDGNKLHVLDILNEMRTAGLESAFICSLMEHCQRYEGVRDLMEMWSDATDPKEQSKIIADLQECIDEIINAPQKKEERPYLRYDDIDIIKHDVVEFKQNLRKKVDLQGGISALARKTGIPQPSLSRFFSSASMPRRTTLYKIANALNLPESEIGFKWSR